MKCSVFVLTAVSLFFLLLQSVYPQEEAFKTRVAIIPMENMVKDEQYSVICGTVTDTVELTLKLIGEYNVTRVDGVKPYEDPGSVKRYAERNKIDSIIFGKAYLDKNRNMIFQMSVYDRNWDVITITEERKAESIFEIFDAAEELVVSVVETFSGIHVGFGTIRLFNLSEKGDFEVFIDGEFVGRNLPEVKRVLNGVRRVEVKQKRLLEEHVVLDTEVEVYEDEVTDLSFNLLLVPEEAPAEEVQEEEALSEEGTEAEVMEEEALAEEGMEAEVMEEEEMVETEELIVALENPNYRPMGQSIAGNILFGTGIGGIATSILFIALGVGEEQNYDPYDSTAADLSLMYYIYGGLFGAVGVGCIIPGIILKVKAKRKWAVYNAWEEEHMTGIGITIGLQAEYKF